MDGLKRISMSEIVEIHNSSDKKLGDIRNSIVVLDSPFFEIRNALSFYDCVFEKSEDLDIGLVSINTTECFRTERCELHTSICVWGRSKGSSISGYLGRAGPNVFFDDIVGKEHDFKIAEGPSHKMFPKIQISGEVNHCRIRPHSGGRINDFAISQCRFSKFEIQNSFGQIQFVDYKGDEIYFKDFDANFIWFRENLKSSVAYVEFDMSSIDNIEKRVLLQKPFDEMFTNSIKMIMEVLRDRKEGRKFNKMNNAFCHFMSQGGGNGGNGGVGSKLLYGWFKNFYSIGRMALTSLIVILIFTLIYWLSSSETGSFGFVSYTTDKCIKDIVGFWDSFYFSVITFTTVGYGDIQPSGFLRFISALEGYIGVSMVLVSSFVFGRQYSDY